MDNSKISLINVVDIVLEIFLLTEELIAPTTPSPKSVAILYSSEEMGHTISFFRAVKATRDAFLVSLERRKLHMNLEANSKDLERGLYF